MIVDMPVLRGRCVALRPYAAGFTEDELRALYRWGRDRELLELAGGSRLAMSFERFQAMFLKQLPRRNGPRQQLFAVLAKDGGMIGRIGLFGFDPRRTRAELGIVIGERSRWGQGYGRDAVATLTNHGFDTLGLERIVLFTFLDNERAQKAFAACGFRVVGQARRFTFGRGVHTELEMELRAEWR